jgi:hypothetical protein
MIFPEDEEFLSHYGVKGMKWGVMSAKTKRSSIQRINIDTHNKSVPALDKLGKRINKEYGGLGNKAGLKAYNKGTQQAYKKTLTKKVEKARADVKSGKVDKQKAKLQADYIKNKQAVGRKEAKRIFDRDSQKTVDTIMLSKTPITGKEISKQLAKAMAVNLGAAAAGVATAAFIMNRSDKSYGVGLDIANITKNLNL